MMGCGGVEAQNYHSMAFVRRGAYKYHRQNDEMIIDPLTAMFFAKHCEYAVSHPFQCGDDCIEFRFENELLREARPALRQVEKKRSRPVRTTAAPISSAIQYEIGLLAKKIELGRATGLEIEESALSVLNAVGVIESAVEGSKASHMQGRNKNRARRLVEQSKEILLSDLGRDWSLSEIAQRVDVSPFHLTRLVRKFTGFTLHRFLVQQRLAIALHRILEGADNITALAFDLGFSSHSHFSAAFKKEYGQPPSSIRMQSI